ncbi:MAG: hypothetical protein JSV94_02740 [Methanobacteriota archaeon]|nr:MAG: hypothetical protein JSV94_02740 [Euryarchaeota archaeon]
MRRSVVLLCALSFCVLALPLDYAGASTVPGWGTPVLIEDYHEGGGFLPDIAVDGDGNAFAVWNQYYGAGYSVMANRYVAGNGWMTAEIIDLGWGTTGSPKVVSDGRGNAFATWQQSDGIRTNIWACRYVQDFGWEVPELVETNDAFPAIDPAIAVDSYGNALVVWIQNDGTYLTVYSSRYTDGVGWEYAGLAGFGLMEEDANLPDLAGDGSGTFTAVWMQDDGTRSNIRANRYNIDTGWETVALIETGDGTVMGPSVAMDSSGNAMTTWYQYDGLRYNIYANRYEVGSGWGAATLIENMDDGYAEWPSVGMDDEGNAIVVWRQWVDIRANAMANRYVPGVGWGDPEYIESYEAGHVRDVRVAVNGDGVAFAVWNQYDSTYDDVWSNRYTPDTGWEGAVSVESSPGSCASAAIGVDDGGNAIAVWGQVEYDFESMFANRFVVADVTPPPLAVTSPLDGATTTMPSVTVSGETEPGAELYVNGLLAHVDDSTGEFVAVVPLVEGTNDIVITAFDTEGNSVATTITVTYEEPEYALDTNLTALQEEMALLQEGNAALLEQLNSTQDMLDDVMDRLDAAEEELDQAEREIDSMPTSSLVFGAAGAIAAILFIVMLAMYIGLRKQMRGADDFPEESEPPSTE